MLFRYEAPSPDERRVLDRIEAMRHDLRYYVAQSPRRWTGLLARLTRARAMRASNSIEGIDISAEDAIAVVDNEAPEDADKATWQAVEGYRSAMDYILQRCRDDSFLFSVDVLLAVHFMISQHDLNANPGNFRPGWVCVRNSVTGDIVHAGDIVHEGVDRDALEPLVDELIDYLNDPPTPSIVVQAAMVHLNIAMLHPFSDGNGRAARCLQTAVLANEGIVAPIYSSIEEYIGRNQQAYYDVLAEVGGGGWNPQRDSRPWVRFCILGHYRQAQTLLRRTWESERLYDAFSTEAAKHRLHERTVMALLEAASGIRVRNSSYRASAGISNNLASRDLKNLVDAGLLEARGERRGRHYVASGSVRAIREKIRLPKLSDDPFEEAGRQPELFG